MTLTQTRRGCSAAFAPNCISAGVSPTNEPVKFVGVVREANREGLCFLATTSRACPTVCVSVCVFRLLPELSLRLYVSNFFPAHSKSTREEGNKSVGSLEIFDSSKFPKISRLTKQ